MISQRQLGFSVSLHMVDFAVPKWHSGWMDACMHSFLTVYDLCLQRAATHHHQHQKDLIPYLRNKTAIHHV